MDMERNIKTGVNFRDLLLVAFIVLKLCGVINWSWIWVLSPFWISIILTVIFNLHKKEKEETLRKKTTWAERMEQMKKEQAENERP